jgi:DNA-directed RNA polymerase specialized sigma24 family protein
MRVTVAGSTGGSPATSGRGGSMRLRPGAGGACAYVRARGEHALRVAVLLTEDWHAAEDLVQAGPVKRYRAWPRLGTATDPDAYLRRIMVNTQRS